MLPTHRLSSSLFSRAGFYWNAPARSVNTGSRRTIVTQISPTTSLLRSNHSDNEIYLLGTAHISEASANEVIQLVHQVQPTQVFLELDPPRAARLRHSQGGKNDEEEAEQLFLKGLQRFTSGGGGIPFGGEEMLKNFFRGFYGILKRYGYVPGVEMLAAMQEADRVGAELFYGDRDINDTLRELAASLNPAQLMKAASTPPPPELQQVLQQAFAGGGGGLEGLGDSLEALKTREHARLMTGWMDKTLPQITEVMLHRRDRVMAQNLRKKCGQGRVLAVVGLAHMDGIEREWESLGKGPALLS